MGYMPPPPPGQDWSRPELTWRDWVILGLVYIPIVVLPAVFFAFFLMALAYR